MIHKSLLACALLFSVFPAFSQKTGKHYVDVVRKDDGKVKELFTVPGKYTTNWITFYADQP